MLSHHVETKALQNLEIVDHGFATRGSVETIWPVALVQSTEVEEEFAVDERSLDAIDFTLRDGPETGVACHFIILLETQLSANVLRRLGG